MKIADRCKELFETQLTNKEIESILFEEYDQVYRVNAARYRYNQNKEVDGDKEYTPKHVLTDTGYKINYSNTYVEATHENIRKSFMMYCVGGLTMNSVALKMGWTRAEFNAIKTAFHITKDAPPFTPYEIDQLTADEMAEIIRIEKKRYSLAKFEDNKHNDIVKEIKRHNESDYFVNRVAELFASHEVIQTTVQKLHKDSNVVYTVRIGDIHSGLEIDSFYNKYDLDIMEQRFNYVLQWIRQNIPKGNEIILTDGGDTTHGLIHGSVQKHGTYVVVATVQVIKCYEMLIAALLDDYVITFSKVNGSHESIEKNKQDRTEEENLGNLITFSLERIFSKYEDFKVIHKLKGLPCSIIPISDKLDVMLDHGDNQSVKKYAETAKILNQSGYNIKEVWLHHLHHYQAEFIEGVLVERIESFCGSDQYSGKLGLHSPCGFRFTKYSPVRRISTEFVEFIGG